MDTAIIYLPHPGLTLLAQGIAEGDSYGAECHVRSKMVLREYRRTRDMEIR